MTLASPQELYLLYAADKSYIRLYFVAAPEETVCTSRTVAHSIWRNIKHWLIEIASSSGSQGIWSAPTTCLFALNW